MATGTSAASSISTDPAYAAKTSTATTTTKKTLDQQDFLNLLITQLKNQDPLNPMKDTEFISQMASFSSLQETSQMNTKLTQLLSAQQQQNGALAVSMIGKQITDVNGTTGLVTGVRMADDGVKLVVNGNEISMADIRDVRNAAN